MQMRRKPSLCSASGCSSRLDVTAVVVRPAMPKDAVGAVAAMRESITELCGVDHQNDPETLEAWLKNKTHVKALSVATLGVERRPATSGDLDVLFAINESALRTYVEATYGPWDEAFQRNLFTANTDLATHELFLRDAKPIGLCCVVRSADAIDLHRLSLVPAFQSQGIGTALLNELTHEAWTRGVPLRLQVFPVNPAQNLYRRLGFRDVSATSTHLSMEWHAPTH